MVAEVRGLSQNKRMPNLVKLAEKIYMTQLTDTSLEGAYPNTVDNLHYSKDI